MTEQLDDAALLELHGQLQNELYAQARDNFEVFVRLMAPEVIPMEWWPNPEPPPPSEHGKWLVWGAHLTLICSKLQALENGTLGKKKLMIFAPPGPMKTVIASNLFPAWYFGRHLTHKILSVGHTTEFAEAKFGRVVRDLMMTPQYKKIFPEAMIREDVQAKGSWQLTTGGMYQNAGAGKQIAGHRANLGIMDDLISEQTANSKPEMEKINKWYPGGFTTRLLPNALQLLINTRWRVNDISAEILKLDKDEWEVVSIPALFLKERPECVAMAKQLGLPLGGSYWPEQWTKEHLLSQKKRLPAIDWEAQYMQTPVAMEGNVFKERDFLEWPDVDPPAKIDAIVLSMDTAFSEKTSADYSVLLVAGVFHLEEELHDRPFQVPHVILLGVRRGRWPFPQLREIAMQMCDKHKPDYVIIEKKASGQSLVQELRLAGVPVVEYNPDRDKLARAHSVTGITSQKRIWMPNRSWTAAFKEELLAFPNGEKDDQVDAFVQMLIWYRDWETDRKSTRLNSSHEIPSRMPSSA